LNYDNRSIFASGKHSAAPFSSLQQFLMLMPRINEAKKTLAVLQLAISINIHQMKDFNYWLFGSTPAPVIDVTVAMMS